MEKDLNLTKDKFFFSNACHVCRAWGKDVELKRCSSCKMIAYCNREHQKEHWPQHKEMCRIVSKFEKSGTIHKFHAHLENTMDSWISARENLIKYVESAIERTVGRQLLPFELEMLAYPRCCEICHETDPRKLHDCTECPVTSFCIKHPKDKKHSAECKIFKFCYETSLASLDFRNFLIASHYGDSIPQNMDHVINRFVSRYPVDKIPMPTNIWGALLSSYLTRPLTFLYAMEKLPPSKFDKITIHVVGSSSTEICSMDFWELLLHYKLQLKELKVVFVGPEISTKEIPEKIECLKNNRKINIRIVQDLYANFAAGQFFTKPDYVIGFQLGMYTCPLENDTWAPTIKLVAKVACPFFVTSFNAKESKADQERNDLLLGKSVAFFWAGKNPFSGLKPCRAKESDEFSYENQYLTIYEKLS